MRSKQTVYRYISNLRREIDKTTLGREMWTYDEKLKTLERKIKKMRELLREFREVREILR